MENQITTYFDESIAACQAAVAVLNGDNRTDEAIFEKIRMNVFDIFRTVYNAGAKACGGDRKAQCGFLLARLEEIHTNWEKAHESAIRHGNSEKAHIERLKLDTAEEIRQFILKGGNET